jgi:hypothetical protein
MQFGLSGVTSGRDSGSASRYRTEPHFAFCATILCREKHSSSPNYRTLRISLRVISAVLYSENCSQGNTFRNHGGHQIDCDCRTQEDSKKKPSAGAFTMAG